MMRELRKERKYNSFYEYMDWRSKYTPKPKVWGICTKIRLSHPPKKTSLHCHLKYCHIRYAKQVFPGLKQKVLNFFSKVNNKQKWANISYRAKTNWPLPGTNQFSYLFCIEPWVIIEIGEYLEKSRNFEKPWIKFPAI